MTDKKVTPVRLDAQPGLGDRSASAGVTPSIPARQAKRHVAGTAYTVTPSTGDGFRIVVSGRERWALEQLREAGLTGCTPIDNPAPRWSAYVFDLRSLGVEIETIHEPHVGDFPGTHARYVLRATVTPWTKGGAA